MLTKVTELVPRIQAAGIPVTQMMWYPQQAPPLPYAVLVPQKTDSAYADDGVLMPVTPYLIELYQERRSIPLERRLQAVLDESGTPWARYHTTKVDDGVIVTAYTVTLDES